MNIDVHQDDLSSAEVQSLIAEHLSGMHSNSPPGHVHALAIESLRAPSVTFWTAWADGILCGCGALKELDPHTGEVKSMRTCSAFLRRGVGQAVLDEIVRAAHRRGYSRLLLETGTGPAFEPAHALYRRNGFEWSSPFGEYAASHFNLFMAKALALGTVRPNQGVAADGRLPPSLRSVVCSPLNDSRDPEALPLSDEQRRDLDQRLDELERDGPKGVSWDEALQDIRSKSR